MPVQMKKKGSAKEGFKYKSQWQIQDFQWGDVDLVRGGTLTLEAVSKILCVLTKECGPLGGVRWVRPRDPPMFQ